MVTLSNERLQKAVASQEMIEYLSKCLNGRGIILLLNNKNFAGSQLENQIRNQSSIIEIKIGRFLRGSLSRKEILYYLNPKFVVSI